MKPKVGEVWLMDSRYSWGQCLVEITEAGEFEHIRGHVLDAEKDDVYFDPQLNVPNDYWVFSEPDYGRKLE